MAYKGYKFTVESRKRMSDAHIGIQAGKKHPRWKGGRHKTSDGYICVLSPNHPFVTRRGYVLEHRLIMEEHIGRYLKPKEIIHHINGARDDNRIENLKLLTSISKHGKEHSKGLCDDKTKYHREYNRIWRPKNRAIINEQTRIRRKKDPKRHKEIQDRYHKKHPEKRKEIWKNYYEKNKERLKAKSKERYHRLKKERLKCGILR